MRKRLFVTASLAAWMALAAAAHRDDALRQELCDPGLTGNEASALSYQPRGDRCEGIYKLEVNSTQLRVSSVIESFEPFDASQPEDLTVRWSLPAAFAGERVRLRAESLRPRTFYRMDAVVPESRESFSWTLEVLDRLGYSREDLGVRGWVRNPEADRDDRREIYLPLRIRQDGDAPSRAGTYEVAVVPDVRLEEVYVTVTPVNARGDALGPPLHKSQALEYGYYPAKSPTFIELTGLTQTGFYEVEIQATFYGGDSGTTGFLLYHEE